MNIFQAKPIPGYPGYFAMVDGTIWSCRTNNAKYWSVTMKRKATVVCGGNKPLQSVGLISENNRHRMVSVGILMLITFVGPRPKDMIPCYRNRDRTNNRLDNLYWGCWGEGVSRRVDTDHPHCKISFQQVQELRRDAELGLSSQELAYKYDISKSLVKGIRRGELRTVGSTKPYQKPRGRKPINKEELWLKEAQNSLYKARKLVKEYLEA